MTSFTWSHTFNGQNFGAVPNGPGDEIYAGGGWGNTSNTASTDEKVTFTGTWTPDPSLAFDPAPPSVVVKTTTAARSYGIVNGTNTPGTDAGDGESDSVNSSGIASGTNYRVETGSSFTENLTLHASYTNPSGFAYASVGGVSVSIVNGNWDGPYYFHYGNYYGGSNTGPWANNTASSTPAITDVADSNNLFSETDTTADECTVAGSITPVWFWNGPDLGQAPPYFPITITTTAFARDYNQKSQSSTLQDGYGNTSQQTSPPASFEVMDAHEDSVTVGSDSYAPGEGNGYWALGPTVNLSAGMIDNEGNTPGSYNMYSSVILTAAID